MIIRSVKYKNPDNEVQSGLSLSPADIANLTHSNKASSLGSLADAVSYDNIKFGAEIPFEKRRGVDINQVWRESNAAKKRIADARTRSAIESATTVTTEN